MAQSTERNVCILMFNTAVQKHMTTSFTYSLVGTILANSLLKMGAWQPKEDNEGVEGASENNTPKWLFSKLSTLT